MLGGLYEPYLKHLRSAPTATSKEFFEKNNIRRYCCTTRFITHIGYIPDNNPLPTGHVLDNVDSLKQR